MYAEVLATVVCLTQLSEPPAPSSEFSDSLEVRYARAHLQLAEANLHRVEQSNKRVARSVPSSVVAEYQRDVQVAKTRLEQVTGGPANSEFQVWLQRAEAEHRTAETTWKNAMAVNVHAPGTFDPLDIDRFRLRAEIAKLQLERGKALIDARLNAQLRWEIDLLDNQVQRLKDDSRRTPSYIRAYPYWWQ